MNFSFPYYFVARFCCSLQKHLAKEKNAFIIVLKRCSQQNFIFYVISLFYFDINHLDGRPASPKCNRTSPVVTPPSATTKFATCCNCFGPLKSQWDDAISNQMSEVYCRVCDTSEDDLNDGEFVPIPKDRLNSPAILTNVTQRRRRTPTKPIIHQKRIYSNNANGSEDFTLNISAIPTGSSTTSHDEKNTVSNKNSLEDYELGDDVATNSDFENTPANICKAIDANDLIRVRGKEELPALSDYRQKSTESNALQISVEKKCSLSEANISKKNVSKRSVCSTNHPLLSNEDGENFKETKIETQNECASKDNSENQVKNARSFLTSENVSFFKRIYSTLPKMKKITANSNLPTSVNRPPFSIPMRITSDGTTIYYICDLPKHVIKGVQTTNITIFVKSNCFRS